MSTGPSKTILCLASYEKGHTFMKTCAERGFSVVLLTSESLKDAAAWPMEAISEIFYMPDDNKVWNPEHTRLAVSHLARTRTFDRVVPMDDFDLELAAAVREHLRVPGMGETTTRHFRDKLAMRVTAQNAGLCVPEFVHLLNDERVREFTERVPPPWVLKPRFLAGAIGIQKLGSREALLEADDKLGDERSFYVLERHVAGDVFHVDSLVMDGEVRFACSSGYGRPPLDVTQSGDVFSTRLLERGTPVDRELCEMNAQILSALRLRRGASHTEFIRGKDDGRLYFLETSARVGGAHITDVIEAATGINLWKEWAIIEMAGEDAGYEGPTPERQEYAGLLISLAKEEHPDTSAFDDPEIVWRMNKRFHVGFIVRSPEQRRVEELLDRLGQRIKDDLHAFVPPPDRPME